MCRHYCCTTDLPDDTQSTMAELWLADSVNNHMDYRDDSVHVEPREELGYLQ